MKPPRTISPIAILAAAIQVAVVVCCLLAPHRSFAQDVPPAVLAAEQARISAIEQASKSTVAIFAKGGGGGGSGVLISADGYALTNFHVVQPCGSYMQCGLNDGKLYDGVVVGIDPTGDVALIKLLGRDDFPAAEFGDSDAARVGDWCYVIGNPFLLATDFTPTVSYGMISGVHRYQYPAGTLLEYADCLQTDAAINPGNSGGPLFDATGKLIGINGRGSFEKRGRVNVGVGYAISINQIKNFLGCLKSGRIVDHATLGASVTTSSDGRVLVANILESSDAYRRGLRYDDEIIAFGGRAIDTTNAFKNALGIFPKGWRTPLTYRRERKDYTVVVRLSGVHGEEELINLVDKPAKPATPKIKPGRPQDKPDDSDKPKRQSPGEDPLPADPHGQSDDSPPPAAAAKLIETRRGYANYYFNKLNQDRVWNAFEKHGKFATQSGAWTLAGEIVGGGAVKLSLDDSQATGDFVTGPAAFDSSKDFDEQLDPPQSGGLLATAWVWRRLLIAGPESFGLQYYGTAPDIDGVSVDVLTGVKNVAEVEFAFDPATGQMQAAEMRPGEDLDYCHLTLSDYRDVDGRLLPFRWQVKHGDSVFAEIVWSTIELTSDNGAKEKR